MNIDLKISFENITIITSTLQPLYNTKAITRRQKSTLSISHDVLSKLEKKFTNIKLKTDLFNSRKKITISFKHHEADMLELLLIQEIKSVEETYIRQKIQSVIDQLNQQLA
ncbi:hypothetical protein [Flavobacterium sp. N1994]|uniref:hypothetical protein n=1 Tax=Flavobacterium sp. N1994 TaxID=2986827 RepID=UPI0022236283|nr:hypothetical protein [Flavobacterium sp. N1994]